MKAIVKKILLSLIIIFIIILVGYLCLKLFSVVEQSFYKSEFDKFSYDRAKKEVTQYLKENRK